MVRVIPMHTKKHPKRDVCLKLYFFNMGPLSKPKKYLCFRFSNTFHALPKLHIIEL